MGAALGAAIIAGGAMAAGGHPGSRAGTRLPVKQIERALHAKGSVIHGVLSVGLERDDITNVHIGKTPIRPAFEINGEADFQPLSHNRAFLNGDIALRPNEINRFISALLRNGLTFQAEHQHMYDFKPIVWFIHYRGKGDPVKLARAIHNALTVTATPFPQAPPPHPHTSLNPERLRKMLHGYDAEVGADGVVTVYVGRRNPIYIDGVRVKPETNIATNIAFEPLNKKGTRAAVVPDFGMEASEINKVVSTMRNMGWDIGCLYNQETAEHPQLYFSHEFKVGNPYELAAEVRKGLSHTNNY
jgi:hypothetical protein